MPEPIDDHVDLASLPKEERLARMRHSAAHVLAEAMLELMPEAKLGIGPPIDTGFYYDFELPRPLTDDDLARLTKRMTKSIQRRLPFQMAKITRQEAEERWRDQPFKLDLLKDLPDDAITQCTHGQFTDLCRGGHVNHTGEIPPFKLMNIAAAYWRGDEKNPQLVRVYGALFENEDELEEYLRRREEAERRDHRRLGRELELFTSHELIGQGLPILLPKGAIIRSELERFIVDRERAYGYQHIYSPVLGKVDLYKTSGHWDHYKDVMFPPMELEHEEMVLRPMNCPHHILAYQAKLHSYRDLPVRIAELGAMFRYERSGVVGGLSRVRAMTLNDAHIFCRPDQVEDEIANVFRLVEEAFRALGITEYRYRLSLRDPADTEKYVQDDEMWETGERVLRGALDRVGLDYYEAEGEAAFYGPKLDIQIFDSLGREETIATIQVDLHLPRQFKLRYIGEDGAEHRPVIIHRGVIGTFERMLAYLIELYEGNFPVWLAPVQAVLIPIADRHIPFAREVYQKLHARGLRAEVDERSERMNAKIRHHQLQKVPYMLIVGDREVEEGAVAVRVRGGEDLGAIPVDSFVARLSRERDDRDLTP
ncbi:MAG: threonine--tRNA ligase [Dehalococcoidia bacterium]